MKRFSSTARATLTALVIAAGFAGAANANCVTDRSTGIRQARPIKPKLNLPAKALRSAPHQLDATAPAMEPSISGYWYSQIIIDDQFAGDGFEVWHADGTQVLNDTSAPSSGNVCFGVWTKTGPYTYTLKHPSWIFDDAGVNAIGIVLIYETVTLSEDGENYSGTTSFDAFDLSGNLLQHGDPVKLIAVRIHALDPAGAKTGIPGLPDLFLQRN